MRVIDATLPEKEKLGTAKVKTVHRHHPRHAHHARVRADGSVADEDAGEEDDEAEEEQVVAVLHEEAIAAGVIEGDEDFDSNVSVVVTAANTSGAAGTAADPSAVEASQRHAPAPPLAVPTAARTGAPTKSPTTGPRYEKRGTGSEYYEQAAAQARADAAADADDEALSYLRQADQAAARTRASGGGRASSSSSSSAAAERKRMNATTLGGRASSSLWKVVPGTVKDVVEGHGENATVYSVDEVPPPDIFNGSYVSDPSGALSRLTRLYLNRNMSLMERTTPFRVVLAVVRRLPRDAGARRLFGRSLLRHWYGTSRTFERTNLLLISLDGYADVVVGARCRPLLRDPIARHFSLKAMELLTGPRYALAPGAETQLDDCALKLVFYVVFTLRSRAQLTMLSMRALSMMMMMFMMMVMTVTKQQQARRYAALYGRYPYPDGTMPGGMANMPLFGAMSLMAHREAAVRDEMFWHDFESGRRGGDFGGRNELISSHVRLRLLQQLLLLRASGYLDEEEDEWEDEEEEYELVEGEEGNYAEADEREDEPPALRGYSCGRGQR